MNDSSIIDSLSKETGIPPSDLRKTIRTYFIALKNMLNTGTPITIEGFGKILPGKNNLIKTSGPLTKASGPLIKTSGPLKESPPPTSLAADETGSYSIADYETDTLDEIYNSNSNQILADLSDIGIEQKLLAEKVFDITPNTLRSYRKDATKEMSPRLKELALGIHELYTKGKDLFLNIENFNQWLNKEHPGLENRKPVEMMNTVAGIQIIMEELLRIEFGATA